jgi:hypothetical protein
VQSTAGAILGGDMDCSFRSLVGDATGDGAVFLGDMLLVKSKITPPIDVNTAPQFDIVANGSIGLGDMLLTKSRITVPTKMALCP